MNKIKQLAIGLSVTTTVAASLLAVEASMCSKLQEQIRHKNEVILSLEQTIVDLQDETRRKDELWVNARQDLMSANIQLIEVKESLNKFVNPIEYNVNPAPLYDIALSDELQQYTYDTCLYYDIVDYYEVVLGLMWRESSFRPDAISSTNDYGIMQINACNHEYLKRELNFVDIMDVYNNIESGVYMLSTLVHEYDDSHKALMAYNMGPNGAEAQWRRGNYTSAYSRDVIAKAELIASNLK